MIYDKDAIESKFIANRSDQILCEYFTAGIIRGMVESAGFVCDFFLTSFF